MRFAAGAVLVAAMTLMGCMGPEGNPNRKPYASDPGGTMAVKAQTVGSVSYDPYGTPAPFTDMQAGQAAINPPMPMPAPQANPPLRPR